MAIRRRLPLVLTTILLASSVLLARQAQPTSSSGAKVWLGRHQEFEEFLKTAKPVGKMEKIPVGVTSPKKVALEPGGLVEFIAWKPLRPGYYGEFYESYKAEIAAYELDKLLKLDMVPPTVEKKIEGEPGAAIMWISGTKSFSELGKPPDAPPAQAERWNLQLVRAMMFDNLIGNEDPNLGNWLMDNAWNLILIDHSRALRNRKDLFHKMNQIDKGLWERMKALDEPGLTATVGSLLTKGEIKAILERRERMQQAIDKLVKEKGEAQVIIGRTP